MNSLKTINPSLLRSTFVFGLNARGAIRHFSTSNDKFFIDSSKLQVQTTLTPRTKYQDKNKLLFGHEFTDHMLEIEWNATNGWGTPRIVGFHDLVLPPAASSLHYAIQCFEGMKAYKDLADPSKIRLFRPDKNMDRLNASARRLLLPSFNNDGLLDCIKTLVKLDAPWIPEGKGYSLYVRPTLISTQHTLGVGSPSRALLFVINSPVGPYYPTGFKAVSLLADDVNVRAWPGGAGATKIGANYAPTILPQAEAAKKGFSQVLWLLNDYVTEVGTMNMFTLWKNKQGEVELITPPLDGTILHGVTRDSILELARKWGEFKVSEKPFTIHELITASKEGRLLEAFGAGTAAIVSPISSISYKGTNISVPIDPQFGSGKLTKRFADTIMGIQYGEIPSDWSVVVK
eukprot:TRINITY_DN4356_c0_g1_i1.p1 TRINITY_DN4356_c0_g1~~TRINITY_DN4356_c0_g1_i1.p1  ORF type:complete len:402 (-),score=83.84 TRINITY_DN4356_c0_g1_i1:456-1661(-)